MSSSEQEILDIFCKLTTIPHGSGNTTAMLHYLKSFANDHGYETKNDKANNLLAFKKNGVPKICYQSHYDMVCVGNVANNISLKLSFCKDILGDKTYTWLRAQDSSLGADNGMGIAIILYFIKRGYDCEFLFTNDEEIGLLGAKALDMPIKSTLLVNLDSEVLGEITIGCAGGYDSIYKSEFNTLPIPHHWNYYILQSRNFSGGHSGLDINNPSDNFQNAILKSLEFLDSIESEMYVVNWEGGEKRNSIPMHSKIVFATKEKINKDTIKESKFFTLKDLDSNDGMLNRTNEVFLQTRGGIELRTIATLLRSIDNGVIDSREHMVLNSRSLSQISFANGVLKLAFMGRANTKKLLDSNLADLRTKLTKNLLLRQIDGSVVLDINDYYPPWESTARDNEETLNKLLEIMQRHTESFNIKPKIVELHAGLECGVLLGRFSEMGLKNIHALSIGPTILSPHSTNEKVWVESAGIIVEVLENFYDIYA